MERGVHLCYERALRGTEWGELPHSYVTVLVTGRLLINEFPLPPDVVVALLEVGECHMGLLTLLG